MTIKYLITLIFLTTNLVSTSYSYTPEKITIATLHWPPYVHQEKQNDYVRSIVTAIFKYEGIDVEFVFLPWERALKETDKGKYQAISPIYISDSRLDSFYFSAPFAYSRLSLIRNKVFEEKGLQEGMFSLVRGYHNTHIIDSLDQDKKVYVKSDIESLRLLSMKRVDYAVVDKAVSEYLMQENNITGLQILEPEISYEPLYIAFPRSLDTSKSLVNKFNKGFFRFLNSGELKKHLDLFDKH